MQGVRGVRRETPDTLRRVSSAACIPNSCAFSGGEGRVGYRVQAVLSKYRRKLCGRLANLRGNSALEPTLCSCSCCMKQEFPRPFTIASRNRRPPGM